jgi:hypothetical protein
LLAAIVKRRGSLGGTHESWLLAKRGRENEVLIVGREGQAWQDQLHRLIFHQG